MKKRLSGLSDKEGRGRPPRFSRLHAFICEWNQYAEPFAWTRKSFDKVLAKVDAELPCAA